MIVAVMLVIGHTEWHVTRHGRVAASREGSATDRDSLSTRHADGSPMLVEVDAAALDGDGRICAVAEGGVALSQRAVSRGADGST